MAAFPGSPGGRTPLSVICETSPKKPAGNQTASECPPVHVNQNFFNCDEMDGFSFSFEKETAFEYSTNLYLTLDEGELKFKNLTQIELLQPESKVVLKCFKSTSQEEETGRTVMLYIQHDGQKFFLVCSKKNKVKVKAMDPPTDINENTNNALFKLFKVEGKSNIYKLESQKYKKRFLKYKDNKLVLCKTRHEVNEHCEFSLFK